MITQYPDLNGKVALVTGGSRGLGAATCQALAANGVNVAVNGRDPAVIDTVVQQITSQGGTAVAAPGDVTDTAQIETIRESSARSDRCRSWPPSPVARERRSRPSSWASTGGVKSWKPI